jgi:D-alanine-D-alanine ligase-like ATP-grasp enzyme
MKHTKPRIIVFYGGSAGNFDLSAETGRWICQYIPRHTYDVVPVEVTADGKWKVPLGSLPRTGPIGRTFQMLSKAVRALSPAKALERLMHRPVHGFVTVVRGRGGDDGSLHSLGQALHVPVVGSPHSTCQITSNKHLFSHAVSEIANTPFTHRFRGGVPVETIIDDIRDQFLPPLFIKPACEEGSYGIEHVGSIDELASAISKAHHSGDILLQEKLAGTLPARPTNVEFDGSRVLDSDQILQLETVPGSMVVVGAGVNLEVPDGVPGAGAIGNVEGERVLAAYLSSLRGLMDRTERIIERWRAVSHTLGRTIQGTTVDGGTVRGVAVDLDETGALLVDTDAGRVRVAFGDVKQLGVNQG